MLRVKENEVLFEGKPIEKVGMVRHSKSFRLFIKDIAVVGYAPRFIIDDESGFLVLIDYKEKIYYFNFEMVEFEEYKKLEQILSFSLHDSEKQFTDKEMHQGATEILYPKALKGKRLFRNWSYFTPKGLIKLMGYKLSMDNPMWERLTDEVVEYIRKEKSKTKA